MHRKRFKHHVHIFCHMFCGWQLFQDFDELQRLESGVLEVNVKDGSCLHNGTENKTLVMPRILHRWFFDDLAAHNIDPDSVQEAKLQVNFCMNEFGVTGGKQPEFLCQSQLVAGESRYTLKYDGEHGDNDVEIT